MRISVPVNHNYYEEAPIRESALGEAFAVKEGRRQKTFATNVLIGL